MIFDCKKIGEMEIWILSMKLLGNHFRPVIRRRGEGQKAPLKCKSPLISSFQFWTTVILISIGRPGSLARTTGFIFMTPFFLFA
jgi:hypothetical protein